MSYIRTLVALVFVVIWLAGCSSAPVRELGLGKYAPRKAERELSAGISSYENGNYQLAAKRLQGALDAGLTFKSDQISAHKYLAFIYCTSERVRQCREEFKKALEIDPNFELSTAEAGHPIWGPVFSGLKAEQPPASRR